MLIADGFGAPDGLQILSAGGRRRTDDVKRRVAITGLGVVSPLGNDVDAMFRRVTEGRSGIRRLASPRCETLRSPIGAPVDFDAAAHLDAVRVRMLDRVSQMALAAAGQAIVDSKIDFSREDVARCGVSVGSSMGAFRQRMKRITAFTGKNRIAYNP